MTRQLLPKILLELKEQNAAGNRVFITADHDAGFECAVEILLPLVQELYKALSHSNFEVFNSIGVAENKKIIADLEKMYTKNIKILNTVYNMGFYRDEDLK